ncbi:MAG: exodeoxyribonuclease VII large subunit [Streptosporangiaceae bacterium]|jgi:exodeoxyribonuclease VII large subunit|nr:exodeoxyribonuclease VII large subunit [Actinomycetota bacterium]
MPLTSSAESPVPVRTVLRLVGDWIGRLGRVWVEGQIAELNKRGSTVFLTLRDPVAAISVRVVCPRTVLEATAPAPEEGARVVVWAKPEFNTARGAFSLSATEIRAVGIGELLARLERLRRALAAEGLFAAERKRPLPFLPAVVGLICGRDSAAERDVLRNAARRWPAVQFRVEQVAVQGSYAVTEVIGALRDLDADPSVEVIIVARGGGSIEDLLPFSDEELIRAVAACGTPVISAIGHEQDVPLLDLAADARASTPTDAARRAVPDVTEQLELIGQQRARARRHLAGRLDRELSWLSGIRSRPVLASPVLELDRRHEQLQALTERARRSVSMGVEHAAADIVHTRARLIALSPAATLRRGYAIVQRDDASVIRSAAEVQPGEALTVRFADDQLAVTASQDSRGEPGGH